MDGLDPLSVLIVDPSDIARNGCMLAFDGDPRFTVLNAHALIDEWSATDIPDIVVIDPKTGDAMDAMVLSKIAQLMPGTAILLVTDITDRAFLREAFRIGARGVLSKSRSPSWLLLSAAYAVGMRSALVADLSIAESFFHDTHTGWAGIIDHSGIGLSRREREILALLAEGKHDQEIGLSLGIKESTVRTHIERLALKLRTPTRFLLGVEAQRSGLLEIA